MTKPSVGAARHCLMTCLARSPFNSAQSVEKEFVKELIALFVSAYAL
jgi:hypothetical protein